MSRTERVLDLGVVLEVNLGSPVGQLRAAPVCLGPGSSRAFLVAYCADFDIDPWVEMFFFPSDTLKLAVITEQGEILWRRDLGRGVVPGVWFCPVLPFDLDGGGADEIWFVNNPNADHPLGLNSYLLERLDGATGETTGQWPWPHLGREQSLSHTFRNFLAGGRAVGEPVLVTAQGTYEDMYVQAWRPDMSQRWAVSIGADTAGARGSHMCSVVDIDGDGNDELMWGERCLRLATGEELFCADTDTYGGHSDIVQPVLDRGSGRWSIYTCRESDNGAAPRVCYYDNSGRRVWGAVDRGHMDMGWAAHLAGFDGPTAMAIRIGSKICGPDGRFHFDRDEFTFEARTGAPRPLPFSVYQTVPVDLNGDGHHELVRGIPGADGAVIDASGAEIGNIRGPVALAAKFANRPGEQILAHYPDGTIRIWADRRAEESTAAWDRFATRFYAANSRLFGVGYHLGVLGGL